VLIGVKLLGVPSVGGVRRATVRWQHRIAESPVAEKADKADKALGTAAEPKLARPDGDSLDRDGGA
jgi:hypothetical protein